MMTEISLNILDVAENSVKAKATLIKLTVCADFKENLLTVVIEDNGCGMTDEQIKRVTDPFYTTRTTRKVGIGVPFFKSAAVTALGMAWKAGIAAEVLCTPDGTVGKMIAHAKRDIETAELFAWTIAVVAVCFLFEKLLSWMLSLPERRKGAKK